MPVCPKSLHTEAVISGNEHVMEDPVNADRALMRLTFQSRLSGTRVDSPQLASI